jgi:hypothetical protein
MRALFVFLLLLLIGGIGYGYIDAYVGRQIDAVDAKVTAKVTTAWDMVGEARPGGSDDNEQLYAVVFWEQPAIDKRVSSIRIWGDVVNGDKKVTSFDAPCERNGSTWLGDAKWTYGDGFTSALRYCYIALDYKLPRDDPNQPVVWEDAAGKIANMHLKFSGEVKAVNKPMRYVTWINERLVAMRDSLKAPFQR